MAHNNTNNQHNPFSEAFKNFSEWSNFNPNKVSPIDMNSFASIQKRNTETLSQVNKLFTENAHSLMRRNAEITQENAAELFHLIKDVVVSPNHEHTLSKQADFVRAAFESTINNAKELTEMATKSTMELFDLLGQTVSENFKECIVAPAQKKKAAV
ncbi:phasin family protein [Rickettsiales bacterium Ac37b]|nr:phasin family protein [Rickettsiales bacterium Ac37b]